MKDVRNVVMFMLACACALLLLTIYVKDRNHQKTVVALTNAMAEKDKTIETQKGVYERLAVELDDIMVTMDRQNAEVNRLYRELKNRGDKLLVLDNLVLRWKKAYEAAAAANQTEQPSTEPGKPPRVKVDFRHDFGYIGVSGYTVTSPPEAHVKVEQLRPLRLSLVVSQDSSKKWRTSVTSSEENVGVDISLAAVNPWFFSPRWYEKIGLSFSAGVGGSDIMIGTGVNYRFKRFDLGPAAWFSTAEGGSSYYGLSTTWHPFQRD